MKNHNYDVFISFAVKDRTELVHPLLILLQKQGLKVWYSTDELAIGESLERTILSGLEKSKFGLFLITPNSLDQPWPANELNAMWSIRNMEGTTLLPVLHKVSMDDAVSRHPVLNDKWSLSTERGLEHIAFAVANRVRSYKFKKRLKHLRNVAMLLTAALLVGWMSLREYNKYDAQAAYQSSSDQSLHLLIRHEIDQYMEVDDRRLKAYLEGQNAIPILNKTAIKKMTAFDKVESPYNNFYQFETRNLRYEHKKHVEPAAAIDFDTLSIQNDFSFKRPLLYLVNESDNRNKFKLQLSYFNTQPITYKITEQRQQGDTLLVTVNYRNYLRSIKVNLDYGAESGYRRVRRYQLVGLPPSENIKVVKVNDQLSVVSD